MKQFSIHQLTEFWKEYSRLCKAVKNGTNENDLFVPLLCAGELPDWNDLCENLNWKVHAIDGGYYSEAKYGFVGIYRLIAYNNGANAKIPRFCGVDDSGTLYVGKSNRLHARLNQLRRSHVKGKTESSHPATAYLRTMHNYPFPDKKIMIASLFTPAFAAEMAERDLLLAYRFRFGELPPLNVNTA